MAGRLRQVMRCSAQETRLDSLRTRTEFMALLNKVHQLRREVSNAFLAGGGDSLLGIQSEGY